MMVGSRKIIRKNRTWVKQMWRRTINVITHNSTLNPASIFAFPSFGTFEVAVCEILVRNVEGRRMSNIIPSSLLSVRTIIGIP